MAGKLEAGAFVELRGRPWLVEETIKDDGNLETLKLSCIADDAQGEQLEIIWDAEIGPKVLGEDNWQRAWQAAQIRTRRSRLDTGNPASTTPSWRHRRTHRGLPA